jgi:hypothetical protein
MEFTGSMSKTARSTWEIPTETQKLKTNLKARLGPEP